MSSQALRYETIIREAEDDGRSAGDTILEILQDVDARLTRSENTSSSITDLETALKSYGTDKIDTLLNPVYMLIKSKADLGALLNAQTLSTLTVQTGQQSCVLTPPETWGAFAPSRYLNFVATNNSELTMAAELVGYDAATGSLYVNVVAVTGTGQATGWNISPSAVAKTATVTQIDATPLFAGPNLQQALFQISDLLASKADASAFTDFGKSLSAAADADSVRALLGASALGHTHAMTEIVGLQSVLSSKADLNNPLFSGTVTAPAQTLTGTLAVPHRIVRTNADQVAIEFATATAGSRFLGFNNGTLYVHTAASVGSGKAVSLDGHVHTIANVSGLQAALDAKQAALGFTPQNVAQKGIANGYAPLGGDGKVPSAYLPADGSYKGTWNAATNTPAIVSSTGNNGDFYFVGVAGTTSINGVSSWSVGDQIRFGAGVWQRVPNTNAVLSVAGKTGAVALNVADLTDATATGQALVMAANAAGARSTLGLGSLATLSTIVDANVTNGTLTNASLANVPTATFKGRASAGTGAPEDMSVAQVKTLLALGVSDVSGLQALLDGKLSASATSTYGLSLIGATTAAAARTALALGSLATLSTVATANLSDSAVTNAKLANVQTATIKGRASSFPGAVEDLTVAQVKGMLAYGIGDITGLQSAIDAKLSASAASAFGLTLLDDTSAAAARTTLGLGSLALLSTIVDANVTPGTLSNASLASVGSGTIKGRVSTGNGPLEDLTPAQVKGLLGLVQSDIPGLEAAIASKASAANPVFTGNATFVSGLYTGTAASPLTLKRTSGADQIAIELSTPTTGSYFLGFAGNALQIGPTAALGTAVSLAGHQHGIADISGLQAVLDNKATATAPTFTGLISGETETLSGASAAPLRLIRTSASDQVSIEFQTATSGSRFLGISGGVLMTHTTASVGSGKVVSLEGHQHSIADIAGLQQALNDRPSTTHTHAIADVTGLQEALDAKAALTHTHAIADVTNLQTTLNGKAATVHGHTMADVSGLQTAIDGKAALSHTHTVANVTGLQGLLDGKASLVHTHAVADVTGLQGLLDAKAPINNPTFQGSVGAALLLVSNSSASPVKIQRTSGAEQVSIEFSTPTTGSNYLGFAGGVLKVSPGADLGAAGSKVVSLEGHAHAIADVTGLQAALDAKIGTSAAGSTGLNLLGAANVAAARTTLGLGTLATLSTIVDANITNATIQNASLANVATGTMKGRVAAGSGAVADLTPAQVKTLLAIGISDVASLQAALDGKASASHGHAVADVTGLQALLDAKAPTANPAFTGTANFQGIIADGGLAVPLKLYRSGTGDQVSIEFATDISGSRFIGTYGGVLMTHTTASVGSGKAISLEGHGHQISEVGGLQAALDAKIASASSGATGMLLLGSATAASARTTLGLGSLATLSTVATANVSTSAITNVKLANVASGTFKGRATANTGDVEDLTVAQAKALLAITQSDVSGLVNALAGKAESSHTHSMGDVSGLNAALAGKSATGHGHVVADVTGLQALLDAKAPVDAPSFTGLANFVTGVFAGGSSTPLKLLRTSGADQMAVEYATPVTGSMFLGFDGNILKVHSTANLALGTAVSLSGHGHAIADVSGLQAALDGKSATGHSHAVSDVTGLQALLDGKAAASHGHAIADVSGLQAAINAKANAASPTFTGSGTIPALSVGSTSSNPLSVTRSNSDIVSILFSGSASNRYLGYNGGILQTGATPSLGTTLATVDSAGLIPTVASRVKPPTLTESTTSNTASISTAMSTMSGSFDYTSTSPTAKVLVLVSVGGNIVGNANAADDYSYQLEMRRYDGSAWAPMFQQGFGDFNTGTIAAARQQNFSHNLKYFVLDKSMARSDNTNRWTLRLYGKPDYANFVLTVNNITMTFIEFEP